VSGLFVLPKLLQPRPNPEPEPAAAGDAMAATDVTATAAEVLFPQANYIGQTLQELHPEDSRIPVFDRIMQENRLVWCNIPNRADPENPYLFYIFPTDSTQEADPTAILGGFANHLKCAGIYGKVQDVFPDAVGKEPVAYLTGLGVTDYIYHSNLSDTDTLGWLEFMYGGFSIVMYAGYDRVGGNIRGTYHIAATSDVFIIDPAAEEYNRSYLMLDENIGAQSGSESDAAAVSYTLPPTVASQETMVLTEGIIVTVIPAAEESTAPAPTLPPVTYAPTTVPLPTAAGTTAVTTAAPPTSRTPLTVPPTSAPASSRTDTLVIVTFDPQGGTLSKKSSTLEVTIGKQYGELPIPTREGYIFQGWFTAPGEDGHLVISKSIVEGGADRTLYARWR
jgi:uncharacterized repeat protein (TIGR02543 family)